MNDRNCEPLPAEHAERNAAGKAASAEKRAGSGMNKSMHDGVEVWCDCCSCEAEPYWIEAMREEEQGD
jgi:hypothetical protein